MLGLVTRDFCVQCAQGSETQKGTKGDDGYIYIYITSSTSYIIVYKYRSTCILVHSRVLLSTLYLVHKYLYVQVELLYIHTYM